jgi:hypothetical protein
MKASQPLPVSEKHRGIPCSATQSVITEVVLTVDFVKGTVTQNGAVGRITVSGEGAFFFDVGKFILDFEDGLVFLAASHHAFFEEDYARLCELLG